jgi:hypothetical protein
MLEDIIISRVRVKLLTLFLLNPGKIFHVREIVRQVSEEINAVRRELAHMESCGMVFKEQRANRLFYGFRKEYALYYELMELVCKTTGLGYDIQKNKSKLGKIKFAMMSGQYIRGIANTSDQRVDLLLVGTVVLPELASIVKTEESKRGEINYTVMSEEEFEFRKSRRDPFILSVLAGSRVMLVGDEEELIS